VIRKEQVAATKQAIRKCQARYELSNVPVQLDVVQPTTITLRSVQTIEDTPFCEAFRDLRDEQAALA